MAEEKHIIVLGAGVVGLQTALSLLTSHPAYKITIIATHVPGDKSIEYTSPLAGGHWRSHAGLAAADSDARKWDNRTYEHWVQLLRNGDSSSKPDESYQDRVRRMGLGLKESRLYWAKQAGETTPNGEGLWWRGIVEGFEILNLTETRDERPPADAVFGVKFNSVNINVPQYLDYLQETITRLGARVIKSTVDVSHGLSGAVHSAKRILLSSTPSLSESSILALINATGLSARHIVPAAEATKLYPVRGQTILVKGEAKMMRTYVGYADDEDLAYIIPRPGSGTTIMGGCKQVGNWSAEVDQDLNKKILATAAREGIAEELRTGEDGSFEVLGYQVGWRPGRKGGPRVELEEEGDGKVDGIWVVHAYGHAGGGYQASVGSAEKVVEIIESL